MFLQEPLAGASDATHVRGGNDKSTIAYRQKIRSRGCRYSQIEPFYCWQFTKFQRDQIKRQTEYEKIEVAADLKFLKKTILIEGVVGSIDRGIGESYYIKFQGNQNSEENGLKIYSMTFAILINESSVCWASLEPTTKCISEIKTLFQETNNSLEKHNEFKRISEQMIQKVKIQTGVDASQLLKNQ